MSCSLANIVSAENQSSSIVLRSLFFIILTRLITRSALQLVTATVARIFIRHDRLVNEDNSSNALIGFTKVLSTHRSGDCCCCSTDSSVPSTSLSAASSPVVEMTGSFLLILSVFLQRDSAQHETSGKGR